MALLHELLETDGQGEPKDALMPRAHLAGKARLCGHILTTSNAASSTALLLEGNSENSVGLDSMCCLSPGTVCWEWCGRCCLLTRPVLGLLEFHQLLNHGGRLGDF